jgi:hypothetical protein
MSLKAWTQAGWLREHETRPDEIRHLATVADGDLRDAAAPGAAVALRFEYAYNAALKACLIALYAECRRPGQVKDVHHKIIRSLPLTLGAGREAAADYLDACRERRDRLERADAAVRAHLHARHPELAPE